jgi:hypothetical protein
MGAMMKHFKVKFPNDFYAADFYAKTKQSCRQQVLDYLKTKRLPRGVEIWETSSAALHKGGHVWDS